MGNSNSYMREYMRKRYETRKAKAIKYLGGQCANCGSLEELQFDHVDPDTKSFVITDRLDSRPWDKIQKELDKCQLLCYSCHEEKSIIEAGKAPAKGKHGTLSSYRYCRCAACKRAKSEHSREYNRSKKGETM